jgi:hypothetical protein
MKVMMSKGLMAPRREGRRRRAGYNKRNEEGVKEKDVQGS